MACGVLNSKIDVLVDSDASLKLKRNGYGGLRNLKLVSWNGIRNLEILFEMVRNLCGDVFESLEILLVWRLNINNL